LIKDSIFFDDIKGFTYYFSFDSITSKLTTIKDKVTNSEKMNRLFYIDSNQYVIRDSGIYCFFERINDSLLLLHYHDEISKNNITDVKIRMSNYGELYQVNNDSVFYEKLKLDNTIDIRVFNSYKRFYVELHHTDFGKSYHSPIAYYFDPIDSMQDVISKYW